MTLPHGRQFLGPPAAHKTCWLLVILAPSLIGEERHAAGSGPRTGGLPQLPAHRTLSLIDPLAPSWPPSSKPSEGRTCRQVSHPELAGKGHTRSVGRVTNESAELTRALLRNAGRIFYTVDGPSRSRRRFDEDDGADVQIRANDDDDGGDNVDVEMVLEDEAGGHSACWSDEHDVEVVLEDEAGGHSACWSDEHDDILTVATHRPPIRTPFASSNPFGPVYNDSQAVVDIDDDGSPPLPRPDSSNPLGRIQRFAPRPSLALTPFALGLLEDPPRLRWRFVQPPSSAYSDSQAVPSSTSMTMEPCRSLACRSPFPWSRALEKGRPTGHTLAVRMVGFCKDRRLVGARLLRVPRLQPQPANTLEDRRRS
ncbi:hypothetical protein BJ912DRAFT_1062318 [Pholiota molesta]|nr:hypothetical protein BJ912DRAFT_1062318 [Pholiota molesta]